MLELTPCHLDRDTYGRSLGWIVNLYPGLVLYKDQGRWQFTLLPHRLQLAAQGGWELYMEVEERLQTERENPGQRPLEYFHSEYRSSVAYYRQLAGQQFKTRSEALETLRLLMELEFAQTMQTLAEAKPQTLNSPAG